MTSFAVYGERSDFDFNNASSLSRALFILDDYSFI